jgi:hypothetical protein
MGFVLVAVPARWNAGKRRTQVSFFRTLKLRDFAR